jgi:MraZ protein
VVIIGEYRCKIDEKGRLVIPSRMRSFFSDNSGGAVYVTRGLERCLFLYPAAQWNAQTEKLKSLPFTKGDPRAFTRLFFSGAFESKIDRQGRIALPQNLFPYADLKNDAVVIGVGDRAEIWSGKGWEKYAGEALDSYSQIAEKMLEP